jgi:hypothetical protein
MSVPPLRVWQLTWGHFGVPFCPVLGRTQPQPHNFTRAASHRYRALALRYDSRGRARLYNAALTEPHFKLLSSLRARKSEVLFIFIYIHTVYCVYYWKVRATTLGGWLAWLSPVGQLVQLLRLNDQLSLDSRPPSSHCPVFTSDFRAVSVTLPTIIRKT